MEKLKNVGACLVPARKEKGITLIALIITIIIMLILVGVTVQVVINSDLIGVAQDAGNRTEQAYQNESNMSEVTVDGEKYTSINQYIDEVVEGNVNWERAFKNAVAPASQDEERNNGVIGIGTDGKPVDMDLWLYAIDTKTGGYGLNSEEVLNNEENGGTNTSKITMAGYIGSITEEGTIEGTVPTYIKVGEGEWIAVTSLYKTFQANATNNEELVNLTVAPKIPHTVTNMWAAFISCNITGMPVIPEKVTILASTFYNCTKLKETTTIPSSVDKMSYTFQGCTSLKKTPEIKEGVTDIQSAFRECSNLIEITNIPNSVIDMNQTFLDCTSLKVVMDLPNNVENLAHTFNGCTSLEYGPAEIPVSVKNMKATFFNCPNLQGSMVINANIQEGAIIGDVLAYNNCFVHATTASGITLKVSGSCDALGAMVNMESVGNVILDVE